MGRVHRSQKEVDRWKSLCTGYYLLILLCFLTTFVSVVILYHYKIEQVKGGRLPVVSCTGNVSSPCLFRQRWWNLIGTGDDVEDCSRRLENATSRLREMVTFLPLKDLRFAAMPTEGQTWFMSSVNDTIDGTMSEYIRFPSEATKGRLLCISGKDRRNGTRNSYGMAWADSLPQGATLLAGLTLVSDTMYDHVNMCHGLSAVVPVAGWHKFRGCPMPARLLLFHWGELRTRMGGWVQSVVDATFGKKIEIETLEHGGSGPACFEEAVVFRHNEGAMPKSKRREVYDMIRCRAREYCNFTTEDAGGGGVRLTLLLRVGPRSFKNDSEVIDIFRKECSKVDGCRMTVMRPNNLTFCDQVKLMSQTDVVASQHGAQLTNMIFMDMNGSVMEFFPKGWLELAGAGQYVYHWLADRTGMRHEGVWRDVEDGGPPCPLPSAMDRRCFRYYKNWRIGHNATYLAGWAERVLTRAKQRKIEGDSGSAVAMQPPTGRGGASCSCGR